MSDYMFMLESHLTSDQNRVVSDVSAAAAEASMNLFLTGGAIRDMLGGFAVRDLDFTVEGNPSKLVKSIVQTTGATLVFSDENRKKYELLFSSGVTAEIGMARQERYSKPGGKPHVTPAAIHEDLRGRDFTINALALSLNRGSRGLLLDPTNGLAELHNRELRATGHYTLYDNPIRIFRLLRFKIRLNFQIAERTQSQYANVREAEAEKQIPAAALNEEMQHVAAEPNLPELLQLLEQEKLLKLISPALEGPKLNLPAFVKLQKARQLIPFGAQMPVNYTALFFALLTEKFTPKEKQGLIAALALEKPQTDAWQKLDARSAKLERDLMSAKLQRPSALYQALADVAGEQILYLLVKSSQRLVQDRLRNFLSKYLPLAMEVTDQDVVAAGGVPGTPKFQKIRNEVINKRLDARPKKVPPPEEPAEAVTAKK